MGVKLVSCTFADVHVLLSFSVISVHFDPANYEVREGENKVLILLANRTFHVPFDINVGLFDSTAVGTWILPI